MRLTANLATVVLALTLIACWSIVDKTQDESPDLEPRIVAFRAENYNLNHWAPESAVETSWELEGDFYRTDGREISVSQVLALRESVLATQHDNSVDEEDLLRQTTRNDFDKLFRTTYPWARCNPPVVDEGELRNNLLKLAWNSPINYRFQDGPVLLVKLGGTPEVTLSLISGFPYYESSIELPPPPLPRWKIQAGDLTWETSHPKIGELCIPLFPDGTEYLADGVNFPEHYLSCVMKGVGSSKAANWWNSCYDQFPHYGHFKRDYRFKSFRETSINDHYPGRWLISVEPADNSMYQEASLIYEASSVPVDWGEVQASLALAEQAIQAHVWVPTRASDNSLPSTLQIVLPKQKAGETLVSWNLYGGQDGTLHLSSKSAVAELCGPSRRAISGMEWTGPPHVGGSVHVLPDGRASSVKLGLQNH